MGSIISSTTDQPRQSSERLSAEVLTNGANKQKKHQRATNLNNTAFGRATTEIVKSSCIDYRSSFVDNEATSVSDKLVQSAQSTVNRKPLSLINIRSPSKRAQQSAASDLKYESSGKMNAKKHTKSSKSSCTSQGYSPGSRVSRRGTGSQENKHSRDIGREPLKPINPNQKQHGSVLSEIGQQKSSLKAISSVQKKLRRAKPPREHTKNANKNNSIDNDGMRKTADIKDEANSVLQEMLQVPRMPVDPPGAVLGALPWAYGHSEQSRVHQCRPSFQPVPFPQMNPTWNYQGESGTERSHHWTVPNFLAPFAATVRHPFANFVSSYGSNDESEIVRSVRHVGNMNEDNGNMEGDVDEEMHSDSVDHFPRPTSMQLYGDATAKSIDDHDVRRATVMGVIDESSSCSEIVCRDAAVLSLPSTFAPPEYVEKITKRQHDAENTQLCIVRNKSVIGSGAHNMTSSTRHAKHCAAHQASSPRLNSKHYIQVDSGSQVDEESTSKSYITTILGKRVTMIDAKRKIFVIDLLSPETCNEIREMADDHVSRARASGDSETWRTLYTYTKMDLPVVEVKDMTANYTDHILHNVKKIIGAIHEMKEEAMKLRPRSWKEPHLLLYQALDEKPHHTGIEMHYDGCDYTWQAMLTRMNEYEGGGTYFRCLKKTIKLQQGQVLVHPGELYHKGIDITCGVRCLLVCFTDGFNPKILDDSKPEDDKSEYEENVVVC
mmetsp:Transcript_16502/g.34676  ORF Transcript_16502/g.34676 Transcript_16502/m.34676 type:complete len:720 (+) Transcript_16502:94-2253(+)